MAANAPIPKKKLALEVYKTKIPVHVGLVTKILPGVVTLVDKGAVCEALEQIVREPLYSVIIKPKSPKYTDLKTALDKNCDPNGPSRTFSDAASFITAEVSTDKKLVIGALFDPSLTSVDLNSISQYLLTLQNTIKHFKLKVASKPTSSGSNSESSFERPLFVDICADLYGNQSIVYEKCSIDVKNDPLPHGRIDIIASTICGGDESPKIGVCVDKQDGMFDVYEPIGFSAKISQTLRQSTLNVQVVLESLALSETLTETSNPIVLIAVTRQCFRPYIRFKKDDLLFTTTATIPWWNEAEETFVLEGAILLLVIMLSGVKQDMPSFHSFFGTVARKMRFATTNWNPFYQQSSYTYPKFIRPSNAVSSAAPSAPTKTNSEKVSVVEYRKLLENYKEIVKNL